MEGYEKCQCLKIFVPEFFIVFVTFVNLCNLDIISLNCSLFSHDLGIVFESLEQGHTHDGVRSLGVVYLYCFVSAGARWKNEISHKNNLNLLNCSPKKDKPPVSTLPNYILILSFNFNCLCPGFFETGICLRATFVSFFTSSFNFYYVIHVQLIIPCITWILARASYK